MFKLLVVTLGLIAATAKKVKFNNDHYSNVVGGYTEGKWNYDYSQSETTCPTECTTTTKCGPHCWGKIETLPGINQCAGKSQTPVNLGLVETDKSLEFPTLTAVDAGCPSWYQFADDHAYEVNVGKVNCKNLMTTYMGTNYTLIQYHFHSPAEHAIGSGINDAEVHLVHRSETLPPKFLVLGVILEVGIAPNDFLHTFWEAAEMGSNNTGIHHEKIHSYEYKVEDLEHPLNPYRDLLPASRNYYTYEGSLTTFPCTQGIRFIIFEQPVVIGKVDLTNLFNAVKHANHTITLPLSVNKYFDYADNRPLQPLNGRVVKKYVENNNGHSVDLSKDFRLIKKELKKELKIKNLHNEVNK